MPSTINMLVGAVVGIVLLSVMIFSVALPVISSSIEQANLSGSTLTIANLIPLFLVLGLFVIIVATLILSWL